jgi:hypothetical protein
VVAQEEPVKKIPSLFMREDAPKGKQSLVVDVVTPGCEWVVRGEGVARAQPGVRHGLARVVRRDLTRGGARDEEAGTTLPESDYGEFDPETLFKTLGKAADFLEGRDLAPPPPLDALERVRRLLGIPSPGEKEKPEPPPAEKPEAQPEGAPVTFKEAYETSLSPAVWVQRRRKLLSTDSGSPTNAITGECRIVGAWFNVFEQSFTDLVAYYGDTFINVKLCLFMEGFAFFGTETGCSSRAKQIAGYQQQGANFSYWPYIDGAFSSLLTGLPSTKGGNTTGVSSTALSGGPINHFFLDVFENSLGVNLRDVFGPRAPEAIGNATIEIVKDVKSLVRCNYTRLYGNGDGDVNRPNVHQMTRVFIFYAGTLGVTVVAVTVALGPASGALTGLLGTAAGVLFPFLAYHAMYNYDVGCMFGYPPTFNARLADDIYTYFDTVVLPNCAPPIMDSYVGAQTASYSTSGAPFSGACSPLPPSTYFSCADDPYGFTDGVRVVFYIVETPSSGWRDALKGVPVVGPTIWRALKALPVVSDSVDYYNASHIRGDYTRFEACVKMLWPIHMTTLVLQVAVFLIFVLAAVALLVNLFTTIMVLSLGLDRLLRTVAQLSAKELAEKDNAGEADTETESET